MYRLESDNPFPSSKEITMTESSPTIARKSPSRFRWLPAMGRVPAPV